MSRISWIFLIFALLSSCITLGAEGKETVYREELEIPIDTSNPVSRNYPIDISVSFEHPCWAMDEVNRSVRVFVYHDNEYKEIESQIYDLEHIDREHIRSCRIVFLIPEFADGSERYFVLYSSRKASIPRYKDHVSVREGRFYYEPIRGYGADIRYYLIEEDGYSPFIVCYDGSVTGIRFPQRIVKLKERSSSPSSNNWLIAATFALSYVKGKGLSGVGSMERLIERGVIIDGNLMVRFFIKTESHDGNLETRNVYTYYYSPVHEKRLIVKSFQRIKEGRVSYGTLAQGGIIATMITSVIRSNNIPELNTGISVPYLHFLSEESVIREYSFPSDVSGRKYEWIILPKDDEDLGETPWVSMDFGEDGETFAMVFTNTSVFSKGRRGLQISAGLTRWIDMPGLLVKGMGMSVGRNSYEGGKEVLTLPSNLSASFVSEFYYTKCGYEKVQAESVLFNKVFSKLKYDNSRSRKGVGKRKGFNLTVIPSLQGLSHPLLAMISRYPIPIITVNVFKDGKLVSSSVSKRYRLIRLERREDGLGLRLDVRNFSILQEARFPQLEEGRYVVKVFLDFGKVRWIVGLKVVELNKDKRVVVMCKPQMRKTFMFLNQHGKPIKGVNVRVLKDLEVVENLSSNGNGVVELKLPLSAYRIEFHYLGKRIGAEMIRPLQHLIGSIRKKIIPLYNLTIKPIDSFGLPFGDKIHIDVEGIDPVYREGVYLFHGLPKGDYRLNIIYRSFERQERISLVKDTELSVEIPVEYTVEMDIRDLLGREKKGIQIFVSRSDGFKYLISSGSARIPPGRYMVEVFEGKNLIMKTLVDIHGNSKIEAVVDENPIILPVSFSLFIMLSFLAIRTLRVEKKAILLLIGIAFIVISILLPVWELYGYTNGYGVESKIFLFSGKIFTFRHWNGFSWGISSELPGIVGNLFRMIIFLLLIDVSMILIHLIRLNKRLEKLSVFLSISLGVVSMLLILAILSTILSLSTGSLVGEGNLTYSFPGRGELSVHSTWSLGNGFWIICLSLVSKIIYVVSKYGHLSKPF